MSFRNLRAVRALTRSLALAAAAAVLPVAHAAGPYAFHTLPAIGGGDYASPAAIDREGVVVGASTPPGAPGAWPVLWRPDGQVRALARATGRATGINEFGLVSGTMTSGYTSQAVYWKKGVLHDLPDMHNGASEAHAVSGHGVIVGMDDTNPVYWPDRQDVVHYGSIPGAEKDCGTAVNAAGDVVGWSLIVREAADTRPHLHAAGQPTVELPTPLPEGEATGISNQGLIVGRSFSYDASHAIDRSWAGRWVEQQWLRLPWDTDFSGALGVNHLGHVVGWGQVADGRSHAVLWQSGRATDLNAWIDPALAAQGWVMSRAIAISDHDAIVGEMVDAAGHTMAWELTPAP